MWVGWDQQNITKLIIASNSNLCFCNSTLEFFFGLMDPCNVYNFTQHKHLAKSVGLHLIMCFDILMGSHNN